MRRAKPRGGRAIPAADGNRRLGKLYVLLESHVRRLGLGTLLLAPCDMLLSEQTGVQPELLFVSCQRQGSIQEASAQGPPDRVVEVLAPRTARRDRTLKRQLSQRDGVPHSWLVDPRSRQAVAYRLKGGEDVPAAQAQGQEAFSAPPCPDLVIPLADLWA